MARSNLGTRYLTSTSEAEGMKLDPFTNLAASWTTNGNGTKTDDTTISFGDNERALRVTINPSVTHVLTSTFAGRDLSNADTISVAFYFDTYAEAQESVDTGNPSIIFDFGTSATHMYSKTALAGGKAAKGWNVYTWLISDFSIVGAPTINNVTWVRLRLGDLGGVARTISYGGAWINKKQRPKCVLMYDDCDASQYTEGYAYANGKGLKGTYAVNGGTVGIGNIMTLAQLHTAYDNGWDLVSHTYLHQTASSITTEQWRTNLVNNKAWLNANGFTRGINILATPGGDFTDDSMIISASLGYEWVRGVANASMNLGLGDDRKLQMGARVLENTDTVANGTAYVDAAIKLGQTCIIYFHKFDVAGGAQVWSNANYEAFIDALVKRVNKGLIDVVTFSELVEGLDGKRRFESTGRQTA